MKIVQTEAAQPVMLLADVSLDREVQGKDFLSVPSSFATISRRDLKTSLSVPNYCMRCCWSALIVSQ